MRKFAAEWMLVAQKTNTNARWILKSMNYCMNHFGNGELKLLQEEILKLEELLCKKVEMVVGIQLKCYNLK